MIQSLSVTDGGGRLISSDGNSSMKRVCASHIERIKRRLLC
jgi:hypothetical protein